MKKLLFIAVTLLITVPLTARRFYITNNLADEQEATVTIYDVNTDGGDSVRGDLMAGPVTIANGETEIFNIESEGDSEIYFVEIEWDDEENTETITVTEDNDFYIDENGQIEEAE